MQAAFLAATGAMPSERERMQDRIKFSEIVIIIFIIGNSAISLLFRYMACHGCGFVLVCRSNCL